MWVVESMEFITRIKKMGILYSDQTEKASSSLLKIQHLSSVLSCYCRDWK